MRRVLLLLVLLLMFAGAASAADCYLATTGNDGNTGASIAQAWLTPTYAVSHISPGDTLWVVDGTYVSSTTIELDPNQFGSAGSWTKIKAYNGTPVWDGDSANVPGFVCGESSDSAYTPGYVELNGIHIRRFNITEISMQKISDVIIRDCNFSETNVALPTWRSTAKFGDGIRNFTVDNCSFVDTSNFGLDLMGDRYGTSLKSYNISITDCHFEGTTNHDALQICDYVSDVTVSGCTLYDVCGCVGTYYHNVSDALTRKQDNIIFRDNNCTDSSVYAFYMVNGDDGTITNNTVINAAGDAFVVGMRCNNITISDNNVNGAQSLHDDANSLWFNGVFYYLDNIYTGLTSVTADYYYRSGGELIIRNDTHQPDFSVKINSEKTTGNATIEYLDGAVFGYAYSTVGADYSITMPRWYPAISNFTIASTAVGTAFTLDITPYNLTLVPTNAHLKNVTVNRESNTTYDLTNVSVNSSVATNPTWISATMQNATNTYNVSVDGVYTSQVVSDSSKTAKYQYTSSWNAPHDFEFEWFSDTGFSGAPDPTNLQSTKSTTWVNHTWDAGSGNVTDSYNVSVNAVWYNTTTNEYYYHTGMSAETWSHITVYAYNNTGGISQNSISQNIQTDAAGWSPSDTAMYYTTTSTITITTKTDGTNLFSRTPTQADGTATSGRLVVKT